MHFTPLAYLDPGSGSFIIQLLVAAVLGAGVWIAASWSKIKKIFKKGKTDEETDDDNDADVQS